MDFRPSTPSNITKIQEIAQMQKTSGIWYAWGKKEYMEMWIAAKSLKEHALSIKEGAQSPQGAGLYVASVAWRASTYANPEARLLLAILHEVPTIDIRNKDQQEALSKIGLGFEDLYESTNLAEMFLIYSTAGTYGRLTTNTGVRLTTDLKEGDPTVLKQNYAKFGVDAKPVFVTQAKESGLDLTGWSL